MNYCFCGLTQVHRSKSFFSFKKYYASEGVAFNLPAVVVDHVADTEENLSWVKSKIKRCAREGIKEGEGLKMFKIRTTQVPAEEEGRSIIRTELMILVQGNVK